MKKRSYSNRSGKTEENDGRKKAGLEKRKRIINADKAGEEILKMKKREWK